MRTGSPSCTESCAVPCARESLRADSQDLLESRRPHLSQGVSLRVSKNHNLDGLPSEVSPVSNPNTWLQFASSGDRVAS